MDEFFSLLNGGTRKWTWQFAAEKAQVAIGDHRLGFSSSVLSAASGELLLMQLIWKGKTERSEANVEKKHPLLIQQHREGTHFQNSDTFEEWFQHFIEIADLRRVGRGGTLPVCLILDSATQHTFEGMDDLCDEHNVHIVTVPPGLTHCFQPADQYIIAGLKQKTRAAWLQYIEELYAMYDVDTVIAKLYSSSASIRCQSTGAHFA